MPMFRREFILRGKPVDATLRIAGLGQYEVHLNREASLAPGGLHQAWTDYRKTVTYDTYRVTGALRRGENVLAVLLGNGMYNVQRTPGRYTKFEGSYGAPKLIAELRVRYADGTQDLIASDAHWQVARGPIVFSSIYGGEDLDARRWPRHWMRPGRGGDLWEPASTADAPGGLLTAAIAPDVVLHERRREISRHVLSRTRTVYDMGQNLAGWPTVTVRGQRGATLRLTPGELLNPDGTVSQASTGQPQWWTYTLAGGEDERWTPRFSYWGFRYLQADWIEPSATASEVQDAASVPRGRLIRIESDALSSNSSKTGSFASSSELLNRIHGMIVWAMHNNEVSLLTDCPHRERLGWLEETHLVASGLFFDNDLQRLYAATERNIADAQSSSGMVPTIVPEYTRFGPKYAIFDDSPEWGSATVLAPWAAYRFYGDPEALKRNYTTMQRYIRYLQSRSQDGIVAYGLGDWYDIGPGDPGFEKNTTLGVTGTLMLYEDAVAMQKIASLLGHEDDAEQYGALAAREKDAFNRRFWNPAASFYDTGSQTANGMPIALGIVPAEHREAVLAHLLADIHAHQDHITTGEVGYPYLMRALFENGYSNVLLAMTLRTDPPSYGSQLSRGATALTEAWDANPANSQDHFMLGSVEEWFYRGLGGIDIDLSRSQPSERITIRPTLVNGLSWIRTAYDSQMGRIESDWKQTPAANTIRVVIPGGVDATVRLPVKGQTAITEGGTPAEDAPGVTLVGRDPETVTYRVESGTYHFRIPAPTP